MGSPSTKLPFLPSLSQRSRVHTQFNRPMGIGHQHHMRGSNKTGNYTEGEDKLTITHIKTKLGPAFKNLVRNMLPHHRQEAHFEGIMKSRN